MTPRAISAAAVLVVLGASAANADYLSVSAVYMKPSKSSYTSNLPVNPLSIYKGLNSTLAKDEFAPTSVGGDLNFESSVGFAIAYGFEFSGGMALELEVATRSGKGETITVNKAVSYDFDNSVEGSLVEVLADGTKSTSAKISSNSIMANFVLPMDTGGSIIPYFGAGVGFARASLNGVALKFDALKADGSGLDTGEDPVSYSIAGKSSDSSLAYQFMAGVRFPVGDAMQLKLGYRYFAISDLKFNNFPTDFSSHELDLGVLISF